MRFKLHSEYQPKGDQPAAIDALVLAIGGVLRAAPVPAQFQMLVLGASP